MFLNHFLLAHRRNFLNLLQYSSLFFPQLQDNIAFNSFDHHHLQMIEEKFYLLLENLGRLKHLNIPFELSLIF